jgi:hypothetical protein
VRHPLGRLWASRLKGATPTPLGTSPGYLCRSGLFQLSPGDLEREILRRSARIRPPTSIILGRPFTRAAVGGSLESYLSRMMAAWMLGTSPGPRGREPLCLPHVG